MAITLNEALMRETAKDVFAVITQSLLAGDKEKQPQLERIQNIYNEKVQILWEDIKDVYQRTRSKTSLPKEFVVTTPDELVLAHLSYIRSRAYLLPLEEIHIKNLAKRVALLRIEIPALEDLIVHNLAPAVFVKISDNSLYSFLRLDSIKYEFKRTLDEKGGIKPEPELRYLKSI